MGRDRGEKHWKYKTARKQYDGISKFSYVNNSKCKWIEFTNEKAECLYG